MFSRLLPVAAFVATFGFFFLDKNREARTVLRSGRGLAVVVAMIVGYLVVSTLVKRVVRWRLATSVVMTAVVLGAAAWTILPYYSDTTVNRTVVSGEVEDAPALPPVQDAALTPEATAPVATAPPAATRLSRGELRGIDHEARGTASLIRSASGTVVVRLENFAIEGAPDPVLYVARGEDVRKPGGIKLGRLAGNRGDQLDVEIPAGQDVGPGWTVLIWCERFAVPIANATQR